MPRRRKVRVVLMAGRPCTVCTGPKREEVNAAIAAGKSIKSIAANSGHPRTTIRNHAETCVPKAVALAAGAAGLGDLLSGAGIAGEVVSLYGQASEILAETRKAKDLPTALAGIGKALDCLSLLGKLTGKLGPDATVNVVQAVKVTLRLGPATSDPAGRDDGF